MNATLTATDEKTEYMLLFRDTDLEKRFPDEKVEEAMHRFNDWLGRWSQRGYIKGGQPLGPEGRVLAKAQSQQQIVVDGPFAETKEVLGGYVTVQAVDLDDAAQVASEWPLLDYGATVEVRPVLKFCPAMEKAGITHYPVGMQEALV